MTACLLTVIACSPDDESDHRLPLRASAPPWELVDSADVRIGGATDSAADEFDVRSGLLSAIPWPDGGLLVLDGSRLRRFSPDGLEAWRVGTTGRGPWEFASLASVCRTRGDTIFAFDAGTRRLSILDGDGSPIDMIDAAALGIAPLHACLGTGAVLMVSPTAATPDGGFRATIRSVRADGTPQDVVDSLPFMSHGRLAVLVAHEDWFWSAAPWHNELRRMREDGTVLSTYQLAEAERTLSEEEARNSRTMEAAMGSGEAGPDASRVAPWFDEAVPGQDGALWLRTFDTDTSSDAAWAGISAEGSLLGRFTLPRTREVVLVAVTELGVWLLRRDTPDGHAIFEYRRFAKRS